MPNWRELAIVLVAGAGFALTLALFYPGIMTYDAKYVYLAITEGPGDWQSPAMTWLWSKIDLLTPSSANLFLLNAAFYWAGFALVAHAVARRSFALGLAVVLLAFAPPGLALIGIIWRDVLFASTWLLAAALAFCVAECRSKLRWAVQALALGLVAFGVLLRPNSLLAAPLLAAYALWPARFSWKRLAVAYIPLGLALYSLIPGVYYGLLDAKRQNPLHSILVFDLGGMSHFAKENQFPVTWTPEQNALLLDGCYKPTLWDLYWYHEPCKFVMERLEADKIFGKPALVTAWRKAVLAHPLAYLQHRTAFMTNLLTGRNLTMWENEIEGDNKLLFLDRPVFQGFKMVHDVLYPTPIFRAWPWLLACLVLCGLAWRRRDNAPAAFVLASAGSASIYVVTLFFVGVASDFRYAYWAVLATLAGAAVLPSQRRVEKSAGADGCASALPAR